MSSTITCIIHELMQVTVFEAKGFCAGEGGQQQRGGYSDFQCSSGSSHLHHDDAVVGCVSIRQEA